MANPDRLSALDSTFLHLEDNSTAHMHVASVMVFVFVFFCIVLSLIRLCFVRYIRSAMPQTSLIILIRAREQTHSG